LKVPGPLERLKKRADFLRAARGVRRVEGAVTLETCKTPDGAAPADALRVGFTASRKVGNAVARNRARRRLRAAAAQVLPAHAASGHDYVVIARQETLKRPFGDLLGDLAQGLKRLGVYRA